ncbi:MAG: GNAT family N-acetyltransferase [Candidatus Thorarchaeota archaeon]
MNDIVIRAPDESERDKFYEVYMSGLPGVDELPEERFHKWWERSRESGTLTKLWRVAVLGDEIVGVVINILNSELNWGFVWELAVLPEHRQKGIGSKLVEQSEQLLLAQSPSISHLAIGVKTDNFRALALYEKMDYGMTYLILRLRGKKWIPDMKPELYFKDPEPSMVDAFMTLTPDAYWGNRDKASWLETISQEGLAVTDSQGSPIGYVRFIKQEVEDPHTEIPFHVQEGYGPMVLNACMDLVESDIVELWVQDNHQDILDLLYEKGFKRMESEFLLRKRV